MNKQFNSDKKRYGDDNSIFRNHALRFLWVFRKGPSRNPLFLLMHHHMVEKYGLEIPLSTKIGEGLYLGHAFNITVNTSAVLGQNCNLHKGVTIGRENRGKRKGAPTIGNKVWIGINSTLVGAIKIGDDVLIAPNSYVNIDVPSHSIVIGNPCKIIPRENATLSYINNRA